MNLEKKNQQRISKISGSVSGRIHFFTGPAFLWLFIWRFSAFSKP